MFYYKLSGEKVNERKKKVKERKEMTERKKKKETNLINMYIYW